MSESNTTKRGNEDPLGEDAEAVKGEMFSSMDDVINSVSNSIAKQIAKDLGYNPAESDEVEVEYIEIEGNKYYVMIEAEIEGTDYLYLVNAEDQDDIRIHKSVVIDGKEYVTKLDSEEELDLALDYFERNYIMKYIESLNGGPLGNS